ncbi:MAG TPA: hypothetical protein PKN80_04435, partial [bacterium]|nr:hypothetical protein [bacterium]
MKRAIWISLAAAVLVGLSAGPLRAHPPREVKLAFEAGRRQLTVEVSHQVPNEKRHYINRIEVTLDGRETVTQLCRRQTDQRTQTVVYLLPDAEPGSKIKVSVTCNLGGTR